MQLTREIAEDIYYVGASDRRLSLFENIYPIDNGMSYNSYLLLDEKTVLFDTVDHSVSRQFLENVRALLKDRSLDYLVVNHVEPDHCATIETIASLYPECKIVGNTKTAEFISQFYAFDVKRCAFIVKEGDTLSTGKHTLRFIFAPMVHWPEVMVTYDERTHALFSADAFGTFGALNGNLFADELDFDREWLSEARRYYLNIVGKYGLQVNSLFKKVLSLTIDMLLPLHGPIWRKDLSYILEKYQKWASYTPEEEGVVIAYSSIYGNTEQAVNYLALRLSDLGVRNIHMYDTSKTDSSYILSECFRYSRAVFASSTYNLEIFPKMESLLLDLKAHLYQKRKVGVIENGTWALQSGKKMIEILSGMKDIEIVNNKAISILSSVKESVLAELDALAEEMAK